MMPAGPALWWKNMAHLREGGSQAVGGVTRIGGGIILMSPPPDVGGGGKSERLIVF